MRKPRRKGDEVARARKCKQVGPESGKEREREADQNESDVTELTGITDSLRPAAEAGDRTGAQSERSDVYLCAIRSDPDARDESHVSVGVESRDGMDGVESWGWWGRWGW